ncbi:MAG: PLDc N-terminal domain-containing protein [Desulfamplus sp.]|nr:PLDc N-terminal domain-containing protein [Desulfamplus sp.]
MDTYIVVAGIGMIFWGLTMLAMVNVILKDFGSVQNKAIWGVVALIPFVGWLIYFMFGAKRGVRKNLN